MNFKDIAELRLKENIVGDRIVYTRSKTATTRNDALQISIKIETSIAKILSYYSTNEPYLFPIYELGLKESTKRWRRFNWLHKINKDLQAVGKERPSNF